MRTSTLVAMAAALVLVAGGAAALTAPPVAHAAHELLTESSHVLGISLTVLTAEDCVTVYPGPPPGADVDPDCIP